LAIGVDNPVACSRPRDEFVASIVTGSAPSETCASAAFIG
jgi:hypothetical protein